MWGGKITPDKPEPDAHKYVFKTKERLTRWRLITAPADRIFDQATKHP
jgi:hypothetical protein